MQPEPNSILSGRFHSPGARAKTSGDWLVISSEARTFICLLRPELTPGFENIGRQARIRIDCLLRPADNPPSAQFSASSELETSSPTDPESENRNSERMPRLGDLLAAILRRLWIDAAFALLQRHGILRDCRCAERQARLNTLTPRLLAQLEPRLLTLAVLLSWFLFAVVVLTR